MGSILMKKVCADAAKIIQDETGDRWAMADLLVFGNMGQKAIAMQKPECSTRTQPRKLTYDSTKQSLPSDATGLVKLVRNMGATGATPGDAITITDQDQLDTNLPTWHSDANPYGKIVHYVYDPRDPLTYYVWPKAPVTDHYVEESLFVIPPDCQINGVSGGTTDSPISILDIYSVPLTDYIIFRTYSMEAEFSEKATLAQAHYQAYAQALGIKAQADSARNPNLISGAQADPTTPRTPTAG